MNPTNSVSTLIYATNVGLLIKKCTDRSNTPDTPSSNRKTKMVHK